MFVSCVRARNTRKSCKHSTGCKNTYAAHMQALRMIWMYARSTLLQVLSDPLPQMESLAVKNIRTVMGCCASEGAVDVTHPCRLCEAGVGGAPVHRVEVRVSVHQEGVLWHSGDAIACSREHSALDNVSGSTYSEACAYVLSQHLHVHASERSDAKGCSLTGIVLNNSERGTEACPTRVLQFFPLGRTLHKFAGQEQRMQQMRMQGRCQDLHLISPCGFNTFTLES